MLKVINKINLLAPSDIFYPLSTSFVGLFRKNENFVEATPSKKKERGDKLGGSLSPLVASKARGRLANLLVQGVFST